jgi:predicted nucleotide-binding protein
MDSQKNSPLSSDVFTGQYDVFISYRRQEPDKAFARSLLRDLETAGYKVAIDERDFSANASFLEEMERCVKKSRFTLAVVSPRYFESGNCEEEAIICKVLDMGERKRRLIPLTIEKVEMPTWMYGIVGINFMDQDPIVPPLEKLKGTLGNPM